MGPSTVAGLRFRRNPRHGSSERAASRRAEPCGSSQGAPAMHRAAQAPGGGSRPPASAATGSCPGRPAPVASAPEQVPPFRRTPFRPNRTRHRPGSVHSPTRRECGGLAECRVSAPHSASARGTGFAAEGASGAHLDSRCLGASGGQAKYRRSQRVSQTHASIDRQRLRKRQPVASRLGTPRRILRPHCHLVRV